MSQKSKFIALKNYVPIGLPSEEDFIVKEQVIDLSNNNDVLVENLWLSVDPYMRARMTEKKNYKEPFVIGDPMEGAAIGIVKKTNSNDFEVGDYVLSNRGWRDKFVDEDNNLKKIKPNDFAIESYLGPLGMTGHTAYVGLFKIGKLKKNQTILVSAAGGSVGSLVCQIAKLYGCKVVASTGSDKKVNWLKNELNVDYAFNYKKTDNLVLKLKEIMPDGFDLYFDNVGGDFLEAAIFRMKNYGRIVICGRISQMNSTKTPEGLKNIAHVLVKRLTIKGFLIFDHENESENFQNDMSAWLKNKKILSKDTVYEGLDNAPKAFVDLLNGKNIGKMLVKI